MTRTDDEVVQILLDIYGARFGGKEKQRFLISWSNLRALYGFKNLIYSRFNSLADAAQKRGLCVWDLGEGENGYMIAVVKMKTLDRWRRVPQKVIDDYRIEIEGEDLTEDDDW
jgi:hypothetical protein